MRINVMQSGDKFLNVTSDFVAIMRSSGEVDILPIVREDGGMWIDTANIITIGYGSNTISTNTVDGVTITNF